MELTEEQKDLIILASNLRGRVVAQLTKERKCGYLIRPELTLTKLTPSITHSLTAIGLDVKGIFSDDSDIATLLEAISGLEELSPTPHGIKAVQLTNGRIFQPTTHDEVIQVISHLEELLGMKC